MGSPKAGTKQKDLQQLIDTWEELAEDPYFHEFIVVDEAGRVAISGSGTQPSVNSIDIEVIAPAAQVLAVKNAIFSLDAFLTQHDTGTNQYRTKWVKFLGLNTLSTELSNKVIDVDVLKVSQKQLNKLGSSALQYSQFSTLKRTVNNLINAIGTEKTRLEAAEKARQAAARTALNKREAARKQLLAKRKGRAERIVIPARHTGAAGAILPELLATDAGITRADYFIVRALSTINLGHGDGLYYDFLQIDRNPAKGTALDQFLKDFGANLKASEGFRSDQAAAIFSSRVTGRTRKILYIYGNAVRPSAGTGLITITQDPSDEQVDAINDPIRNLLDFEFAASEVIAERPNGTLAFTLFDAAGNLQNSAPENVVADHTVPAPYTRRLHGAISCLRCHGPVGIYQPVGNDVQKLTKSKYGSDILDDLSSKDAIDDAIDRLTGLYEGDLTKPLKRGTVDFGEAVFRATGGKKTQDACADIASIFGYYVYTDITPKMALAELGYKVSTEAEAVKLFRALVPPYPGVAGVTIKDPIVSALRAGISIKRYQWELIYFDVAFRAMLVSGSPEIKAELLSGLPNGSKIMKGIQLRSKFHLELLDLLKRGKKVNPQQLPRELLDKLQRIQRRSPVRVPHRSQQGGLRPFSNIPRRSSVEPKTTPKTTPKPTPIKPRTSSPTAIVQTPVQTSQPQRPQQPAKPVNRGDPFF